MIYVLNKEGPFYFKSNNLNYSIFDSPFSNYPGLYFWAIKYMSSYLINYIGITAVSFKERLKQHLEYFYSGKYTIYDLQKFLNGEKEIIYKPNGDIKPFMQNYKKLAVCIDDFTRNLIIFLFPLNESKKNLEIIESILISSIKKDNSLASSFLDNDRISRRHTLNNDIIIKLDFDFIGLNRKIIA